MQKISTFCDKTFRATANTIYQTEPLLEQSLQKEKFEKIQINLFNPIKQQQRRCYSNEASRNMTI